MVKVTLRMDREVDKRAAAGERISPDQASAVLPFLPSQIILEKSSLHPCEVSLLYLLPHSALNGISIGLSANTIVAALCPYCYYMLRVYR